MRGPLSRSHSLQGQNKPKLGGARHALYLGLGGLTAPKAGLLSNVKGGLSRKFLLSNTQKTGSSSSSTPPSFFGMFAFLFPGSEVFGLHFEMKKGLRSHLRMFLIPEKTNNKTGTFQ